MTDTIQSGICIFGEVLFDHFPDGARVLGGAPFNVAWHLQAMGHSPLFVSRVGADAEGDEVRDAMRRWGMTLAGLQLDPLRRTGQVRVSLVDGEPHYDIVEDCAYDAIEPAALERPGLLYHGSLAARSTTSAAALRQLRDTGPGRVFMDVNLRPPWWQRDSLLELIRGAHWVKLNHDELCQLQDDAAVPAGDRAQHFLEQYDLEGIIVTHGAAGAELVLAGGERVAAAPRPGVDVVDTVGAGDAFSAVVIVGLARKWPAQLALERAQQFAAAIVGRRGATVADRGFYREILADWGILGAGEVN